jgi:hypothetical protein
MPWKQRRWRPTPGSPRRLTKPRTGIRRAVLVREQMGNSPGREDGQDKPYPEAGFKGNYNPATASPSLLY